MKMIQTTMGFIVAMTILMIVAVQTGTFEKLMAWQAAPSTTNIHVSLDMPQTDSGQPQIILAIPGSDPTTPPTVIENAVATPLPNPTGTAVFEPTATRKPSTGVPFLNDPDDGVIAPNEFFNEFGWGPTPISGDCNVLPPLACPTPTP